MAQKALYGRTRRLEMLGNSCGERLAFGKGMLLDPLGLNPLTHAIIAAAIHVHKALGPGLLESVYVECLIMELRELGLRLECGTIVPLMYRGRRLATHYELDLCVEGKVIVEVKSVTRLALIHTAQLLTYLKLTNRPVGLLINFNVPILREGIKRVVNPKYMGGPTV